MGNWKKHRALTVVACVWGVLTSASWASDPAQVAAQTDQALRAEVPFANAAKVSPGRVGDEVFLRRVSLDLVGRNPTPQEITAFVFDPSPGQAGEGASSGCWQR